MRIYLCMCVWLASVPLLVACSSPPEQTPIIPPTDVEAQHTPPPKYPLSLACAGIGGQVTLRVFINAQGHTGQISVLHSSQNTMLDQSAEHAVETWIFKPATRNGKPIAQSIQVPILFRAPPQKPQSCFQQDEK